MILDEMRTFMENRRASATVRRFTARLASRFWRPRAVVYVLTSAFLLAITVLATPPGQASSTIPQDPIGAPMLTNPGFECNAGTYPLDAPQGGQMRIPNGWEVTFIDGTPWLDSTRMHYNGGVCGGNAHVERIEGDDSLAVFAQDLEWTDRPGKPFDVAVYQQVPVTPGVAYSLSAWMLSLCGGSAVPNDCPEGYYMAKMLGIDPTGGTDPRSETVIWAENRQNFIENGERVGWINLRVSAVAESETITVFGRIDSPFRWHGNHAFIDAFSLVEAPTAKLNDLPGEVDGSSVDIAWSGQQSPQIELIPSGTYQLFFDVQHRLGEGGAWQTWQEGQPSGQARFTAQVANTPYFFRVRARSVQPPSGPAGAWPNHRYEGVWSDPVQVIFLQGPPDQHQIFIPIAQN